MRSSRTETLTIGPIALPMSESTDHAVERFMAEAELKGYAVNRLEKDGQLTVHATKTAETKQPFPRRSFHERFTQRA